MYYSKLTKKRIIIFCAFFVGACFVAACTGEQPATLQESPPQAISDPAQAEPLLTLQELLQASDVQVALAQAAREDDKEALKYWQKSLLSVADEVNLLKSERRLIEGPQGLKFLAFQGMKTNYQNEFERAFFDFEDVQAVYDKYPAFEDAHAQSKVLVQKRDALIDSVAAELIDSGFKGDAVEEARTQWQAYAADNLRRNQASQSDN